MDISTASSILPPSRKQIYSILNSNARINIWVGSVRSGKTWACNARIIKEIKFARESNIPFFGLCYGMQLAAIEFAKNVLDYKDANTTEIEPKTRHPIIDVMANQKDKISSKKLGGTMRLGAWDFKAKKGSIIEKAYKNTHGSERHRHRYEFNNDYREEFDKKGMIIGATTKDNKLVESLEIPNHPFFLGVQFHPELKSRPLYPHPLYLAFMQAIVKTKGSGKKKK